MLKKALFLTLSLLLAFSVSSFAGEGSDTVGGGKLLENAVFLALRRNGSKLHYYTSPQGYEVDFYLPQERRLVQVTWQMDHPQTRAREVRALAAAAGELRAAHALILSDRNEEPQSAGGITVEIRSAAEWLLEA